MHRSGPPPLPGRFHGIPLLVWLLISLPCLVLLAILLFHPVENWRGRSAWQKCRRSLVAKGEELDWAEYFPQPVPDGKNIFKAPKMTQWFVGRSTNELTRLLNPESYYDFTRRHKSGSDSNPVAEVTVRADTNTDRRSFDAVLNRIEGGRLVFTQNRRSASKAAPISVAGLDTNIIPLIILDEVPLTDAIENLAHQAHLKYSLDADVRVPQPDPTDPPVPPIVSVSWEDVTAEQAIQEILDHYRLQGKVDSTTGVFHITTNGCAGLQPFGFPTISNLMTEAIQSTLGRSLKGAQGFTFVAGPLNQIRPLRILTSSTSGETTTSDEVRSFVAGNGALSLASEVDHLQIARSGTNRFRVTTSRPKIIPAADYLAWSDQFVPQFDVIRQALQRPYARMDGDYVHAFTVPIPNYISVRITAQTLLQRAQCYLLLNQPEKALHELTLVHDLCHLLEGKPTGRPMTLVAVMIEAAVTGMYADTVADGLRLKVWREPQLIAIQEQAESIDLPPLLKESLRAERANGIHAMEILLSTNPVSIYDGWGTNYSRSWNRNTFGFPLMPRGWLYQNMVTFATLHQQGIDCIDLTNRIIPPHVVNAWEQQASSRLWDHFRPYTWFAAIIFPNFSRAFETLAKDQSLAEQTTVACALERYHLAHGEYPNTLNDLVPRFIEKLPHDIATGHSLAYHLTGKDHYALYSVGWNETDDGGTISTKPKAGDWVLACSAN